MSLTLIDDSEGAALGKTSQNEANNPIQHRLGCLHALAPQGHAVCVRGVRIEPTGESYITLDDHRGSLGQIHFGELLGQLSHYVTNMILPKTTGTQCCAVNLFNKLERGCPNAECTTVLAAVMQAKVAAEHSCV